MGYFPVDRIRTLVATAIALDLASKPDALLSGLPAAYTASLPQAGSPDERLLRALHALNDVAVLDDGSVPLRVWLQNAALLAGGRPEQTVFEEALRELTSSGERPAGNVAAGGSAKASGPPVPTDERAELRAYLKWFEAQMTKGMRGPAEVPSARDLNEDPLFVPPEGVDVAPVPLVRDSYAPDYDAGEPDDWFKPVQQQMRIVSEVSRGAQLLRPKAGRRRKKKHELVRNSPIEQNAYLWLRSSIGVGLAAICGD